MKYLLVSLLLLAGCTSKTEFGSCVGLGEDKNPLLQYKVNSTNLAIGLIFFELIVPPVIVLSDEFYCPIGKITPESMFNK